MSDKKIKKHKQFLRREYAKNIKEVAQMNGQFLKPKPRWMPMWLWIKGLKMFIKIK